MAFMKKYRLLIVSSLVVIFLVIFIFYSSREKPVSVKLHVIEKGLVESTVANTRAGTVKACRRAKLSPVMGGRVTELLVKEGDEVTKNQLLMSLWNDDLVAQVTHARREFEATKQLVVEACLMSNDAQRDAARVETLWQEKLTTEEKHDKSKTQSKVAEAACRVSKLRAEVSQSRIAVAEASLERSRIKAPFDGNIAEINGEIGEYVTPTPPGVTPPAAIDIVDTSCLYILAPIDEVDAPVIKAGMEARITLDAFEGQHFLGAVRRIAPYVLAVEKQARTVDIEAVFMDENQTTVLLPGYSADLEIILDARHDVLRIRTEAIIKGKSVLLYDANSSRLVTRNIETGLSNWQFTEVLSGLLEGDKIALFIDREDVVDGAYIMPDVVD